MPIPIPSNVSAQFVKELRESLIDPHTLPLSVLNVLVGHYTQEMLPTPFAVLSAFRQKMSVQGGISTLTYPGGPPHNLFLDDYLLSGLEQNPSTIQPTYSKRTIKPLSLIVLLQFIGGPMNTQQFYRNRSEFPLPIDGAIYKHKVRTSFDIQLDENNNIISHKAEETVLVLYRLTFIPPDQTPFSEEQIVLALYQEK